MTPFVNAKCQHRQRQQPKFLSTILGIVVVAAAVQCSPSIELSSHFFEAQAFSIPRQSPPKTARRFSGRTHREDRFRRFSSVEDTPAVNNNDEIVELPMPSVVRAPLKFIGPYPCLALKFPNLATESQRSRNLTGISLDFVLDTAANINTIQGQVAQELQAEILEDSPALPGVSSSGPIGGSDTYMLGDSELEEAVIVGDDGSSKIVIGDESEEENVNNSNDNEPFEFMQNLTAAALPVVNPGSAGLLGLAFFYCFEGGVEFRWGALPAMQQVGEQRFVDGMIAAAPTLDESSPSITFLGQDDSAYTSELKRSLTRVPIDPIPLTQLPSVKIRVNGVEMIALLDTGSPVTVLNERAARDAGIRTTKESMEAAASKETNKGGWNPLASAMNKFKEAQATAEAAQRGDILMIGGIDGKPTNLYRSIGQGPEISLVGSSGEDVSLDLDANTNNSGNSNVYVGDIPGLAALNGIGVDSPPAVVLGMDVLRRRPKMLFRPRQNELYM